MGTKLPPLMTFVHITCHFRFIYFFISIIELKCVFTYNYKYYNRLMNMDPTKIKKKLCVKL